MGLKKGENYFKKLYENLFRDVGVDDMYLPRDILYYRKITKQDVKKKHYRKITKKMKSLGPGEKLIEVWKCVGERKLYC